MLQPHHHFFEYGKKVTTINEQMAFIKNNFFLTLMNV